MAQLNVSVYRNADVDLTRFLFVFREKGELEWKPKSQHHKMSSGYKTNIYPMYYSSVLERERDISYHP